MIEFVARDGAPEAMYCPAFVCDACRKQVVGEGLIVWKMRYEGQRSQTTPLFVAHKGRCDMALESWLDDAYRDDDGWSGSLSHEIPDQGEDNFLKQLTHNSTHAFADDTEGHYHQHELVVWYPAVRS